MQSFIWTYGNIETTHYKSIWTTSQVNINMYYFVRPIGANGKMLPNCSYLSILATTATIFIFPSSFAQPTTATNPFPQLPSPLSNPSSINMTSENKNTYTISSGFTKINNFVTTYTITGGIDSVKSSSDLIVSTIIKDFDANANIGYVKNDLSSQANAQQQLQQQHQQSISLPNPFVDDNHKSRYLECIQ